MSEYRVEVAIGDTWTITADSTVAADPNADIQITDPFGAIWAIPDGERFPAQPDPMRLVINLYGLASALPPLETGTPVVATVYLDDGIEEFAYLEFHGKLGQVDLKPVLGAVTRKVRATLVAVDDDTDLTEAPITGTWASGADLGDRVDDLIVLAAAQGIDVSNPQFLGDALPGTAREAQAEPLLTLLDEIAAAEYTPRFVMTYGVDVAGVTYPAGTIYHSARAVAKWVTDGPFILVDAAGTVGLVADPYRVPHDPDVDPNVSVEGPQELASVVDGCYIRADSLAYHRDKSKAPTVLELYADQPTARTSTATHIGRRARFGSILMRAASPYANVPNSEYLAPGLAAYLLGDEATSDDWQLDALTLLVSVIPDAELRAMIHGGYGEVSWFPRRRLQPQNTSAAYKRATVYARQVVVTNPADEWNLTGRDYLAGQLAGAALTIDAGKVTVTGRLRPGIHLPDQAGFPTDLNPRRLSWEHLAADPTIGAMDWTGPAQHIDPAITWVDLRLSRLDT